MIFFHQLCTGKVKQLLSEEMKKNEQQQPQTQKLARKKYTSNDRSTIFNALNHSPFHLTFAQLRPMHNGNREHKQKKKKTTTQRTSTNVNRHQLTENNRTQQFIIAACSSAFNRRRVRLPSTIAYPFS